MKLIIQGSFSLIFLFAITTFAETAREAQDKANLAKGVAAAGAAGVATTVNYEFSNGHAINIFSDGLPTESTADMVKGMYTREKLSAERIESIMKQLKPGDTVQINVTEAGKYPLSQAKAEAIVKQQEFAKQIYEKELKELAVLKEYAKHYPPDEFKVKYEYYRKIIARKTTVTTEIDLTSRAQMMSLVEGEEAALKARINNANLELSKIRSMISQNKYGPVKTEVIDTYNMSLDKVRANLVELSKKDVRVSSVYRFPNKTKAAKVGKLTYPLAVATGVAAVVAAVKDGDADELEKQELLQAQQESGW